jgi:hypothetical protein
MPRRLLALLVLPALAFGCSEDPSPQATPSADPSASQPLPGVTLPPGPLVDLVLTPEEVPAGMVPVLKGSGPRTIDVVAGYSGTGAAQASAQARLRAHGFTGAYVAQYANLTTGQVVSVLASQFATAAGTTSDFADDLKAAQGAKVEAPTLGEQSSVTRQTLKEKTPAELVLVRFRRGTTTWSLAYKAAPPASAQVAIELAQKLLARTSS